ncbi:asparagine synthase [Microbacterium sp. CJ88]|uniref:asparagine synthase n=1 Tax=Microbacterium sp. CJ88 TaxID=3445672 RepID=UPI003F65A93D
MGKSADAVAEGVSIASSAARLTVRNHILVETISRGETFVVDQVAAFARETLESLAAEQDAAAALAKRQRKRAWGKFSDPDGTHDYRDRDTRNLRKRQRQYTRVAAQLRTLAGDSTAVDALVEQARDAAWGDVEANLQRRLRAEGMTAESYPDYAQMRGARMQALRLVDLPRLAAHQRSAHGEAAVDPEVVTDEAAPMEASTDTPGDT